MEFTQKITPDPLRREPVAPTEPPIDALGPLASVVKEVAHATQAPPALVMQSFLAATTLAVQAHADVEIDGRVFPLSENFFTIAESGERKTAVDQIASKPHHEFQQGQLAAYENKLQKYQEAKRAYYRKKKKDRHSTPPNLPRCPLILIQEPSYEGLIELLKTGWPSLGLFTDEGGRFIGGHAMRPEQRLKTMAGLSELWNGSAITRIRVGKPMSILYGRRFSCHLMVQPEVAWEFLGDKWLVSQGLLGRFLMCYPQSTIGYRVYQDIDIDRVPAVRAYYQKINDFFCKPLPYKDEKAGVLSPRLIRFDYHAHGKWVQFLNEIEVVARQDNELANARSFACKAAEHAARLAGVLTLYANPETGMIEENAVEQGIVLAKFYLKEMNRLMDYGPGQDEIDLNLAEKCLKWIKNLPSDIYPNGIFATCDLYQRGPYLIQTAAQARQYLEQLAQHGWIKRVSGTVVTHGQMRKEGWQRLVDI